MLSPALLLLSVPHAPSAPPQLVPFARMYALGEVGDHDGDGVSDLAFAGERAEKPRPPLSVRILSGATFKHLAEFETGAEQPCKMVLHAAWVRKVGDLDGDGLEELATNAERGIVLDGATGSPVFDFGDGTIVWGLLDDGRGFDRPSLAVLTGASSGCGLDWSCARSRLERREPRQLERTRRVWGATRHPLHLERPGSCSASAIVLDCEHGCVHRESVDVGLDPDGNVVMRTELALYSAERVAPRWRVGWPFEHGDSEHGGCGPFRVAVPGDLDGDGFDDVAVAVAEWWGAGRVMLLSGNRGLVLWERGGFPEALNPNVELVRDRDGDGHADLLVTICDGSREAQILSSKSGAVLARFRP
jgi:hypothetical protein